MSATVRLIEAKKDADREMLEEMVTQSGTEGGVDPYVTGDPVYWLIVNEDGQTVGYTGMHSFHPIIRRCRGLLWVRPEFRQKGYGTAALDIRNRMLFNDWNVNRIEWAIPDSCDARQKMSALRNECYEGTIRQAGFWAGRYHDIALYGLTRDQFYQDSARSAPVEEAVWQL